jgi:cytochrome oxidase Cu insertion factor (SCO1/SenC/PrrC family)
MLAPSAASAAPPAGSPSAERTGGDSTSVRPDRLHRAIAMPRAVLACGTFLAAVSCAALVIALVRPVQVLPFLRPAPPYTLRDASGGTVTSAGASGTIMLFQVSALRCPAGCEDGHAVLAAVQRRLRGAAPPRPVRLVTVVLDGGARTDALRRLGREFGADPQWWRIATADATRLKDIIGAGLGIYYTADRAGRIAFEPATILVDERGIVRADYRTARPDSARIVRDLDLVLREAASRGAARAAYAAAHFFLCYPR